MDIVLIDIKQIYVYGMSTVTCRLMVIDRLSSFIVT